MVQRSSGRLKIGTAILVLLIATLAAPAVNGVVAFFSDAPYVEYIPGAVESAGAAARMVWQSVAALKSVGL
jgi:hypothetical protein